MSSNAAALSVKYTERGRPFADLALTLILTLLTLALVGAGVFLLIGGNALIVRSGSMAPAIDTGDLVVTRTVHPTEVEIGDVVTFTDPTRSGALVTHRAQRIEDMGQRIAFVTKGDANGAVERWTIDRSGTMGRLIFTLPKLGYAVSWAAEPRTRFGLIVAGGLLLAYAALRRIWST